MSQETKKSPVSFEVACTILIGLCLACFHIYTSFFGPLASYQHRIVHLTLAMMMVPVVMKFKIPNLKAKRIFQVTLMTISAVIGIYAFSIADDMWKSAGHVSTMELICGGLLVILLLYYCTKAIGPAMPLIALLTILYAFAGPYLPDAIAHRGYSLARILDKLFKGTDGIFGTPLGVSSIYVSIFLIFAGVLEASGAGDVFIRLTQSLLGGFRGGPAKVAVVASSLFGTISGSAVANVVGTGTFTIPLMKRTGFRDDFAAAVETASSSGGQLMPPVMGAAAFIMADYLAKEGGYSRIITAAIIPAVLFYIALFIMIDIEALKNNLHGQPKEELPNFKEVFKSGWILLLPLVMLVIMLVVIRYSAQKSAFYGIMLLIAIMLFYPGHRKPIKEIITTVAYSTKGMISVALTTGVAGIIVGMLELTGIGYKLSSLLIALSHNNVMLLLVLTCITSVILGMGMPTSAAYVLLATLIVPALEGLGVVKIAAHFFVFYFGIMANVTPPVAVAAYTAAGIAGANAMKTGFTAWRLSLAGFLLPFMFALNPALLGIGTAPEIILAITTALVGSAAMAASVQRYFMGSLSLPVSAILLVGACSMMLPGVTTDILGIVICGSILGIQYLRSKKAKTA